MAVYAFDESCLASCGWVVGNVGPFVIFPLGCWNRVNVCCLTWCRECLCLVGKDDCMLLFIEEGILEWRGVI